MNLHYNQLFETLYSYFTMNDEISVKFDSLVNYAHRRHDEDTANPVYLEMSGRLSSLISDISDASSFEVPEILAISKETLEKFEDCMNEMHSITERDAFSYGFRLGVQLMTEAFLLPIGEDE